MILFSVVIPTYNRSQFLKRSVKSVLEQTYPCFELIIIDNGSDDNSEAVIGSNFSDKRIKYYYQKGSGSPANPRNHGIKLAQGEWICFLDSDDFWHRDKLNEVFKSIHNGENLDVICHNEKIFYEQNATYGHTLSYGPNSENMYREMLFSGSRLSTSATTIRKNFLIDNNLFFNQSPDFATVEDYDLWLNLARTGARFKFLQVVLGYYSVSDSNLITSSGLFCINLKKLLKLHVFEIQNFQKDKNALWSLIKIRFDLCIIRFKKIELYKKILLLLILFLKNPIRFGFIAKSYLIKKLNFR